MEKNCRYKQRAGFIATFYTSSMTLRIRHLRESKGWSQDVLAEKSNISRSQLAQIESEARPANTLRLNAIAAALGVEVFQLFSMKKEDDDLLDAVKGLREDDRATILRMARAFSAENSVN